MKRFWYWPPWRLVNPVWPWFWRGGDEHGRPTVVIQPPLLGAFIFPVGPPCEGCATGDDELHTAECDELDACATIFEGGDRG